MNVLVVDDEIEIADLIELYLKNEGYNVYKTYSSEKALKIIKQRKIDLAILDIMMPGIDGFTLCQTIRKKHNFPIIMVTAKITDADKIKGLNIGADDYITKPFMPLELIARVKAQLRRYTSYNQNNNKIIAIKDLVLDKDKHECLKNSKKIALTPTEFSILYLLAENENKVVTTEKLFEEVWHEPYLQTSSATIMVHIRHLREKLGENDKIKYINTIWGVGYQIEK